MWLWPGPYQGWGTLALDIIKHMVLPVATLTLISFAGTMLLTRNSMLETIREDYVIAARAKGLPESQVRDRHAARNAMLPVVTSLVYSLVFAIDGSVIIEGVFSWPGTGMTLLSAVRSEDLPPGHGGNSIYRNPVSGGPRHCGCALRIPRSKDPLPVIIPEPPGPMTSAEESLDFGRGRLGFVLAQLRMSARSFRAGWGIFMESRLGMLSLCLLYCCSP